jgi:UDP-glucose 4-epimerase
MKNILITGAAGYLGSLLVEKLSVEKAILGLQHIVATDVNPLKTCPSGVVFEKLDIRDSTAINLFKKYHIDCVVHLASIVNPKGKSQRDFEHSVDVLGTKNILKACTEAGVKRIIVSSSGAAYGYHPENVKPLVEQDAIRGNEAFAYSYHKRLIENELQSYREKHPELQQTIFRVATILGERVDNQITDLFKKPFQIGIPGTAIPFSFIWDEDAVECFKKAIFSSQTGIYNLSGDGYVTLKERAQVLKKPIVYIPSKLLEGSLAVLKILGLTQYGPEQTLYLKYRPTLSNQKLKDEFGFIPRKSSHDVFDFYVCSLKKISL